MLIDPIKDAIDPGLKLLPTNLDSLEARVMLLAIGLQESAFNSRVQIVDGGGLGPARGFWQFEQGGAVRGVWRHSASTELVRILCRDLDIRFEPVAMWQALDNDKFAAAMARLLLLTDPQPLPAVSDVLVHIEPSGQKRAQEKNIRSA